MLILISISDENNKCVGEVKMSSSPFQNDEDGFIFFFSCRLWENETCQPRDERQVVIRVRIIW